RPAPCGPRLRSLPRRPGRRPRAPRRRGPGSRAVRALRGVKICVIGSGGREMVLRDVLGRTAAIIESPDDADLVVVGPEQPLVDGLADELRSRGLLVFGPGADGARLEGSKAWMKQALVDAGG